mgnify:CR=1 FL=1
MGVESVGVRDRIRVRVRIHVQHGKHLKLVFHELSPQVDRVLVLNDVDDGGPQTNSKLGDSVWRESARNLSFIR